MTPKKAVSTITFVIIRWFFITVLCPVVIQASMEPPADIALAKTVRGTGTYFELVDSAYLNVSLSSTKPISVTLVYVPETVLIYFEASSGATAAEITLSGFKPQTTYYKYADNYHNLDAITTDNGGRYTYTQELSEAHLIFIQPRPSTIFIGENGFSDPTAGEWDAATKTATLTRDVSGTIQIDSDGITLCGNGHTLLGDGTGTGIFIHPRVSGVTIKNLTVAGFAWGFNISSIYNISEGDLIFVDNTIINNSIGFYTIR